MNPIELNTHLYNRGILAPSTSEPVVSDGIPRDAFGNQIRRGDYVIYTNRRDSNKNVIVGKVTRVMRNSVSVISIENLAARLLKPRVGVTSSPSNLLIINGSITEDRKNLLDSRY